MNNLIADTKFAIELEEKGRAFYSRTAAKTSNPLVASTFSGLAEREREHIRRISEFYENLSGGAKLDPGWLMSVEVPPTRRELLRPILDRLKQNLEKKFESERDIEEAYKVAEGLEQDSFTLYEKIAAGTTDTTARKLYSSLAGEEREHYAILEETLQYLNNPGEWFRLKERWIVEG